MNRQPQTTTTMIDLALCLGWLGFFLLFLLPPQGWADQRWQFFMLALLCMIMLSVKNKGGL